VLSTNPFIEPCLPTLRKEPPTGLQWVHEVKFDGYRLQLHKDGKDELLSKKGNDFTSDVDSDHVPDGSRQRYMVLKPDRTWTSQLPCRRPAAHAC
jgi:hypothetical protein